MLNSLGTVTVLLNQKEERNHPSEESFTRTVSLTCCHRFKYLRVPAFSWGAEGLSLLSVKTYILMHLELLDGAEEQK